MFFAITLKRVRFLELFKSAPIFFILIIHYNLISLSADHPTSYLSINLEAIPCINTKHDREYIKLLFLW